ncbi:ATP synthase subunit b [Chryseobacterium aquaeductus]|uniref:ATP synthase subunit b n=1 Tax=Chryseobacterium aquaeductus TaxID=2675056 RepID=A0A9N8MHW2_9FLAO|nr:F0F1 ATP synthase subunit B [Chryseobacterium aquaeductus]CAA7332059.1 ATP synthase subunit b [Chryseobacterium potabilaquae]CAD7814273.1 ATP synthase subunit b [Chryseobacterium aquaeductus]
MGIIEPGIGLLFWMTLTFAILLFILAKFAWKPIVNAVNDREASIVDALNQAKLAKKEMEDLKSDNERIIREAKIERDSILKEAREIKDRIVGEAKDVAKAEGDKIIDAAKHTIQTEKNAAMSEIRTQIGTLSVNIAESILQKNLEKTEAQDELVQNYLNKSNLN